MHHGWPDDESILDEADAIVIYADGTKVIGSGWAKMDQLVKEENWRPFHALCGTPKAWKRAKNIISHGSEDFSKMESP